MIKILLLIILMAQIYSCSTSYIGNKTSNEDIENVLRSSPLRITPTANSRHYILEFKNGIRGYYKIKDQCHQLSQIVSYQLDKQLKLGMFPPTIGRQLNINGRDTSGTVQYYIENGTLLQDSPETYLGITLDQYSKEHLIRFLSGANDQNDTNYLIKAGKVIAIDNDGDTIQFGKYGDYAYQLIATKVDPNELNFKKFPFHKAQTGNLDALKLIFKIHFPGQDINKQAPIDNEYRKEFNHWTWIYWDKTLWLRFERNYYAPYNASVISLRALKIMSGLQRKDFELMVIENNCPYKQVYLNSLIEKKLELEKLKELPSGFRLLP